ncbi:hypothetical protein ANAPC1_00889 [Anaplasma phagocytophilum]|uniref:Uncharacterized protein n=1 Tax=Anaplasma phagocytophilum TaxID=948 RepID=A0AA45ZHM7_ANAPH|nr:hypothetical protein ANAPC1_00889 [Anaplasma phagocytophilum]
MRFVLGEILKVSRDRNAVAALTRLLYYGSLLQFEELHREIITIYKAIMSECYSRSCMLS